MKEELIGGIRNALERGDSVESSIQSMINAGYNPDEVRESAELVSKGSVTLTLTEKSEEGERAFPVAKQEWGAKALPTTKIPEENKKKGKGKIVLIIVLAIILLALVGTIVYVLFNLDRVSTLLGRIILGIDNDIPAV